MKIKRSLYFTFGIIFLSLETIGILIPLLPTTPFVILATFCLGKSSKKAGQWILKSK
ncbi:MAG: YbaN family protein [Methanobrevibacter sp.]|jgi:uncharacterized membrane protein YbaN (DUF454 family)|nr:YbaN family protein [Candidatus Methanovirga meridionalis]